MFNGLAAERIAVGSGRHPSAAKAEFMQCIYVRAEARTLQGVKAVTFRA
jgi:hypothetical protein